MNLAIVDASVPQRVVNGGQFGESESYNAADTVVNDRVAGYRSVNECLILHFNAEA